MGQEKGVSRHGTTWRRFVSVPLSTAVIVAGVLLVAVAPPATAACQPWIQLFENPNGGGANITICYGTNVNNLTDLTPGPGTGHCGAFGTTWNDCISSVTFGDGSPDTAVCLWTDAGYSGSGLRFLSSQFHYNLPTWIDNKASSVEWGNNCLASGISGLP